MRLIALLLGALLAACGPKLPPRYVMEADIGPYRFRRYQRVIDVELPLSDNPAVGHIGTYVKGGKTVEVVPVFITAYAHASGLVDALRAQLRAMEGYRFDIHEVAGSAVYRMKAEGGDEVWLLWVSGRHLIKVGAPEGSANVPAELTEAYLDRYPTDLDDQGKSRSAPKNDQPSADISAGSER